MSYDSIAANSPTIPLHLQSLFENMNFLGSAVKDGKPCFKSRLYVDRGSYSGAFYRWSTGEKQSTHGNDKIRICCESACQAYEAYKHSNYGPILTDKMLKLRKGLMEIRDTYERSNEIDTVNHINDSIMILEFKLPKTFKIQTGIIANMITQDEDEIKAVSIPIPILSSSAPEEISSSIKTPEFTPLGTNKKKGKGSSKTENL